jgi:hypothetical protein
LLLFQVCLSILFLVCSVQTLKILKLVCMWEWWSLSTSLPSMGFTILWVILAYLAAVYCTAPNYPPCSWVLVFCDVFMHKEFACLFHYLLSLVSMFIYQALLLPSLSAWDALRADLTKHQYAASICLCGVMSVFNIFKVKFCTM